MQTGESQAKSLVVQMGWSHRMSGVDQYAVNPCPFCQNTNYKFFINVSGEEKDGLYDCKVCGETGNLYTLKSKLGVAITGVTSMKDASASASAGAPSPLPDLNALHHRLLHDEEFYDILDYAAIQRGLSLDTISKYKLGGAVVDGVKFLVIPYTDAAGNFIFYKGRSVPPAEKQFKAPAGRSAPLFNQACLRSSMEELFIVEGEIDALTLISNGIPDVVAVPGAAVKKAEWVAKLDHIAPKSVYLLYDNDKAGQTGAREIAGRIGIDKVKNIVLPEFELAPGKGGKDINDWFKAGKSLDDLLALKNAATPFDVDGVQSVEAILNDLKEEIEGKGLAPTYVTPWPSLTRRVGGFEPGDLVGIMAEGKVGKTTLALNWLQYYASIGIPSFLYCQEMRPVRMVRKWVSHVTQTDDSPNASQITADTIQQSLEVARGMESDILFGYTTSSKPEEVADTIRQTVRRYGVKVVCFDNLQLLIRSVEHATAETSRVCKMFKGLAMELGILILLIIQPHRVPDGQIISARNAMGSSAIEKDVDSMICLHRNRVQPLKKAEEFKGFVETEENFEPYMLARVDLSRYAAGGVTTLHMDGGTSTVRELRESDMVSMSAASGVSVQPAVMVMV